MAGLIYIPMHSTQFIYSNTANLLMNASDIIEKLNFMEENIFTRAKQVGIVDVLNKLGARRAGGRGTRLLYHCPFREDWKPSM